MVSVTVKRRSDGGVLQYITKTGIIFNFIHAYPLNYPNRKKNKYNSIN